MSGQLRSKSLIQITEKSLDGKKNGGLVGFQLVVKWEMSFLVLPVLVFFETTLLPLILSGLFGISCVLCVFSRIQFVTYPPELIAESDDLIYVSITKSNEFPLSKSLKETVHSHLGETRNPTISLPLTSAAISL